MVSKQIIIETVKRMYSSGVDDDTVKSTLRDIGLTDSEIAGYVKEVKQSLGLKETAPQNQSESEAEDEPEKEADSDSEAETENQESESSPLNEDDESSLTDDDLESALEADEGLAGRESIADKTAQKIKEHLDEHLAGRDATDESSLGLLEEHSERLGHVSDKLDALHEKMSNQGSLSPEVIAKIDIIEKKLVLLEKDLGEIKASENALQSLLKKILDANKEILNKLSK